MRVDFDHTGGHKPCSISFCTMKPSEEHARYGVSRAKDVGGGGVVQVVLVPEGKQI